MACAEYKPLAVLDRGAGDGDGKTFIGIIAAEKDQRPGEQRAGDSNRRVGIVSRGETIPGRDNALEGRHGEICHARFDTSSRPAIRLAINVGRLRPKHS